MYNTKQEYYDDIIKRYRNGQMPSFHRESQSKYTICDYKGENGKMCLIGMLIPEEAYCKSFEGKAVEEIYEKIKFSIPEFARDLEILDTLQGIHDDRSLCVKDVISKLNSMPFFADVKKI